MMMPGMGMETKANLHRLRLPRNYPHHMVYLRSLLERLATTYPLFLLQDCMGPRSKPGGGAAEAVGDQAPEEVVEGATV